MRGQAGVSASTDDIFYSDSFARKGPSNDGAREGVMDGRGQAQSTQTAQRR